MSLNASPRSALRINGLASPFFHTAEERVDEARQRYFERGVRPSGLVGDCVIQSWSRCLKAGRRPDEQPVFDPISRSRVSAVLERNQALLDAAAPEFDQLEAALAGTGCKPVLVDRRGIVVRAGPGGSSPLLDVSCRIGVDLGELNFGSTAPGISAFDDAACTVSGGEHFYGVLRQIHCAAAPIHNRAGQVVGVLDLSVEGRPFAFDASSLVRLSALAIENRLLAAPHREQVVVAFQTRASLLDTPFVALAAFDTHGRLAWSNPAAATLLPTSGNGSMGSDRPIDRQHPLDVRELFGVGMDVLLQLAADTGGAGIGNGAGHAVGTNGVDSVDGGRYRRDGSRAIVLPHGLLVWVRVVPPAATARSPRRAPGDHGFGDPSALSPVEMSMAGAAAAADPGSVTSLESAPTGVAPSESEPAGLLGPRDSEHGRRTPGASTADGTQRHASRDSTDPRTALAATSTPDAAGHCSLDAANRALIEATLQRHRGNVSKAARELGVSRGLLYRRLRAWGGLTA